MSKSGLTRGLIAATVAMGAATLASAQVVNNDGNVCGAITPDPNGGCNLATPLFQDLGTIGVGEILNVTGTIGTYDPDGGTATFTSRDLDWYTFTLTSDAVVNITLSTAVTQNVLFIGTGGTCPSAFFYGTQAGTPQVAPVQFLTAGTYMIAATTPFEANAAAPIFACGNYTLTIDVQTGNGSCGSAASTEACDVAHGSGGCEDWSCCNQVCAADPLCCDIAWDQSCVTNGAVAICGYFIYSCTNPVPANDCLISGSSLALDTTAVYDNSNANTDGPSTAVTGAASGTVKDVWFWVQTPADGQLTVTVNSPGVDTVLELYGSFDSNVIDNPGAQIPPAYIGTVDGFGAGGEAVNLVDAEAGAYYLIRVGSWVDAPVGGAGDVTATFAQVIVATGPQKPIITGGANTNLGLSSGAIAAGNLQRWLARPFTVGAPQGGNAWELTGLIAKGFVPAGAVNDTLNYIIWARNPGDPAPVAADQLFTGSAPFPAPYDDALDNAANAAHQIDVDPPIVLEQGEYYLSVYGANATEPNPVSNFAWFIYCTDAEQLVDSQGVFTWRSANFPTPGFVRTVLTGTFADGTVQPGDDPNDLLNNPFTLLGSPVEVANPCPADLSGNGSVGPEDLAVLLGAWGGTGPADISGNGSVGPEDLALLLGAWGPCP